MTTLKVLEKGGLIFTLQPHKYDYICEAPYDDCMILFKVYKGFFFLRGGWSVCYISRKVAYEVAFSFCNNVCFFHPK